VRLFVYGSLKRGERHHRELAGARFVRTARTAPAYSLVDTGEYPGLVRGGTSAVAGELFEIDDALLARLDEFEDVPDVYRRDEVELDDGSRAIAYLLPDEARDRFPVLASGAWTGTPNVTSCR